MNSLRETQATSAPATDSASPAVRRADFVPTRWTLVARARGDTPEARRALSELCEAYYPAVLAFLRREGRSEDDARELAQEFFARVLGGGGFEGADQERGRFRSYLLGALKHFLADLRARASRQKRGGGVAPESIEAGSTGGEDDDHPGMQIADTNALGPESSFDREWALEVMRRSLAELEREMRVKGKAEQFEILKPWLAGDVAALSQADAARNLSTSEGAVKVAVHRLRKRFGELVRAEIAQTLREPSQAEEELAHLIAALSG